MLIKRLLQIINWLYRSIRLYIITLNFKKVGKRVFIQKYVCFKGKKGITLGDYVGISSFVHIWGGGGVTIGNRVLIASHVAITSVTHNYHEKSIRFSSPVTKPIEIDDDVWIGSHAVIMPGVKIGSRAVIGAGAIVTKDVPENAIVVGTPARVIKYRTPANFYEENSS